MKIPGICAYVQGLNAWLNGIWLFLIECAVPTIGIQKRIPMYVLKFKVVIDLFPVKVDSQVVLPCPSEITRVANVPNVREAQSNDKPFVIES